MGARGLVDGDPLGAQHVPEDAPVGLVVIHHQQAPPAQGRRGAPGLCLGGGRRDGEREGRAELAAAADLACDRQLAPHQRHQLLGDREAESGPSIAAGHGRVGLAEFPEDASQLVLGDADPRIADAEPYGRSVGVAPGDYSGHGDLTLLRELDGVPDQVHEHLPHAGGVPSHQVRDVGRHVHGELEMLLASPDREQVGGGMHDFREIERDRFELEVLRFDLRVVEDVVEDGEQRLGRGAHQLQRASLLYAELRVEHELDEPEHRVHRRADLVAHVGEERAPGVGRALGDVARLPDRGLGALALGDVLVAHDDDLSRGILRVGGRQAHGDESTIPVEALGVRCHGLALPHPLFHLARRGPLVLGHHQLVQGTAHRFVGFVAKQDRELSIEVADPPRPIDHGDGHGHALQEGVEVSVLARQLLAGQLEEGGRAHALRKGAMGACVHAVHPPSEQRNQDDRDELGSGVSLHQNADRERAQNGDEQVAKAWRVTDQRAGRAGDDPSENDQDEGALVQRERGDSRSGPEPPGESDARHGQAYRPERFLGGRHPPPHAQPPPGPQPRGGGDRADPSDRQVEGQRVPHQRRDDNDEHDVQRLRERPPSQELTDGGTTHLGRQVWLLLGDAHPRIAICHQDRAAARRALSKGHDSMSNALSTVAR